MVKVQMHNEYWNLGTFLLEKTSFKHKLNASLDQMMSSFIYIVTVKEI